MLAVTVTFEKEGRSFERLLLHEAVNRAGQLAPALDFAALIAFCALL